MCVEKGGFEMSNKKWRKKFDKIMEYCGETLIGEVTTEYLKQVFEHQGFYSGVYVRIYEKNGYFSYEEKRYGK